MSDQTIQKDLVRNFLDIYMSVFGTKGYFKSFWDGDPITISEVDLPALIIDEQVADYDQGATQTDDVDHQLLIQVSLNKKMFMGKPSAQNGIRENISSRELRQIVHGRDSSNSQLLPQSVLGVLRSQITNGIGQQQGASGQSFTVNRKVNIKFGVVGRPGGVVTAEAQITVTVNEFLYVLNRS